MKVNNGINILFETINKEIQRRKMNLAMVFINLKKKNNNKVPKEVLWRVLKKKDGICKNDTRYV